MNRLPLLILAVFAVIALIGTSDAAAQTRRFGAVPLQDLLAAAQTVSNSMPAGCTLTPNKLAVLMLVPAWFETVGGSSTATPSPMTLSRADFGLKNIKLYSFGTYADQARAFFHPGIGLWQIDDSGNIGKKLVAYERIDTQKTSGEVAKMVANAYCSKKGTNVVRREAAWKRWFACKGGNFQRCETAYQNHYSYNTETKKDQVRNVVQDPAVGRWGGMEQRTCGHWTDPCYYINPTNAQGHKRSWTGAALDGGPNGQSPSPLALAFYSLKVTLWNEEQRYWSFVDTGYSIWLPGWSPQGIQAIRPFGKPSRDTITWHGAYMCDRTNGGQRGEGCG